MVALSVLEEVYHRGHKKTEECEKPNEFVEHFIVCHNTETKLLKRIFVTLSSSRLLALALTFLLNFFSTDHYGGGLLLFQQRLLNVSCLTARKGWEANTAATEVLE